MHHEKTNLGVKPLGRSDEISLVCLAEVEAVKNYGAALQAAGPVNNEAAAKLHRQAHLAFVEEMRLARGDKSAEREARKEVDKMKSLYDSLGYDY